MKQYIISITAQDHPGIVAGIGEAILDLAGNIEAASQTVHQGYFAMIILAGFPAEPAADVLDRKIRQTAGQDLHVFVTEHRPLPSAPGGGSQTFFVTAVGADRPGILQALAAYLASKQVNIDDLYATVSRGEFIVICQASVPAHLDVAQLQRELEAVGHERGFTAHFQHENIFVATNELRLGRIG